MATDTLLGFVRSVCPSVAVCWVVECVRSDVYCNLVIVRVGLHLSAQCVLAFSSKKSVLVSRSCRFEPCKEQFWNDHHCVLEPFKQSQAAPWECNIVTLFESLLKQIPQSVLCGVSFFHCSAHSYSCCAVLFFSLFLLWWIVLGEQ